MYTQGCPHFIISLIIHTTYLRCQLGHNTTSVVLLAPLHNCAVSGFMPNLMRKLCVLCSAPLRQVQYDFVFLIFSLLLPIIMLLILYMNMASKNTRSNHDKNGHMNLLSIIYSWQKKIILHMETHIFSKLNCLLTTSRSRLTNLWSWQQNHHQHGGKRKLIINL